MKNNIFRLKQIGLNKRKHSVYLEKKNHDFFIHTKERIEMVKVKEKSEELLNGKSKKVIVKKMISFFNHKFFTLHISISIYD